MAYELRMGRWGRNLVSSTACLVSKVQGSDPIWVVLTRSSWVIDPASPFVLQPTWTSRRCPVATSGRRSRTLRICACCSKRFLRTAWARLVTPYSEDSSTLVEA